MAEAKRPRLTQAERIAKLEADLAAAKVKNDELNKSKAGKVVLEIEKLTTQIDERVSKRLVLFAEYKALTGDEYGAEQPQLFAQPSTDPLRS